MSPTPAAMSLVVACLCADWCTSCQAYRATFAAIAAACPDARFVWVDIEDEEALMDGIDVENFPTLLIGDADGPRFFGTVLPHAELLLRLVSRARGGDLREAGADAAASILARLQAGRDELAARLRP